MEEFILAWVLVVAASNHQNPPIISTPVADIESCKRMQNAVRLGAPRPTQCVEVKLPVAKK